MDLIQRFNLIKDEHIKKQGKMQTLLSQKRDKENLIKDKIFEQESLDKARILLLKTGDYKRQYIKSKIEEMVSNALQYIREENIYFSIKDKEVRGRTEFDFYITSIRDGIMTETTIADSRGDGIADIVYLSLCIAMHQLSGIKGPLILDEPAKQVSERYRNNVGSFLKEIANTLNIQIIMITHDHKILQTYGDNQIEVILEGTTSRIN